MNPKLNTAVAFALAFASRWNVLNSSIVELEKAYPTLAMRAAIRSRKVKDNANVRKVDASVNVEGIPADTVKRFDTLVAERGDLHKTAETLRQPSLFSATHARHYEEMAETIRAEVKLESVPAAKVAKAS